MLLTHFECRHSTTAIINFDCRRDGAHWKFRIHSPSVGCLVNKFSSQFSSIFILCTTFPSIIQAPLICRNGETTIKKTKTKKYVGAHLLSYSSSSMNEKMLKLKRPIFIFPMMITNFEIVKYCCVCTTTMTAIRSAHALIDWLSTYINMKIHSHSRTHTQIHNNSS